MKKFLALSLMLAGLSFTAHANHPEVEVDAITQIVTTQKPQSLDFVSMNKKLSRMEDVLKSGQVSTDDMNEYVKELASIQVQLQDYRKGVDSDLSFSQKKIDALGEAPKEGETESEAISQNRQTFNAEYQALKTKMADADIATARIDELETLILNVRNRELFDNLLDKHTPLIYPNVLLHSAALSVDFFVDIIRSPYSWYGFLTEDQKDHVKSNMFNVFLTILITILFAIYMRSFIMRKLGYRADIENPRYATKVFAAFFVALARGLIPAFILIAFLVWIYKGEILTVGFFGLVFTRFLQYLLWTIFFCTISRVTFAPFYEKWRLINIDSHKALKLTKAFYFAIIASGLATMFLSIAIKANYNQELIYLFKAISAGIKAFSIAWIVKVSLMNSQDEIKDEDSDSDIDDTPPQAKFEFIVALFSTVLFLACILGYPNLTLFILNRIIASLVLIGLFLVIRKAIKEISHRILLTGLFSKTFKFRRKMVEKVDFWTGLIVDPILFFLATFIILTMWGVSTDLLLQSTKKFFTGFQVGGVTISLVSIFTGIAAFIVCLLVVKLLQGRIRKNVLSHMDIDDGIKHSLDSGFGFIGIIIAILLGIVVMGGNLASLAIIAGALSVGIGFGLQSIVNNLVSGFILLFERPVKIGDWVIVDGREGIIKQINIRATIIETWDRANLIIPNSTLLQNNLINMTWHDQLGRADIKVGVAYGTDLDRVREILLEIAAEHPKVTKKPEPYVVVTEFGTFSINLELRAYLSDVMSRLSISSALREAIKLRFEEERIEIPFPQQVVHDASQNVEFLQKMSTGMVPSGTAKSKALAGKLSKIANAKCHKSN